MIHRRPRTLLACIALVGASIQPAVVQESSANPGTTVRPDQAATQDRTDGSRAAEPDLTVMSFNIRYNNPGDGEDAWPHLADGVAALVDTLRSEGFIALQVHAVHAPEDTGKSVRFRAIEVCGS